MNEFSINSLNLIFLLLLNVVSIWISLWVYLTNKKEKINQLFFLVIICLVIWTDFNYAGDIVSHPQISLIFKRIYFSLVSLFFIFAYFFSIYFPTVIQKRHILFEKFTIFILGLISFLTTFTNFVIKDVKMEEWGVNIIPGKGIYIFYSLVTLFVSLIVFNLVKKYSKLTLKDKLKLQYFLVGVILYAFFQVIFNVVFPLMRGTKQYWQVGDYSAIFLLGFTAYAIVKRELFGIKVVLTQILVGVIAIVLLVQALGSATIFEYIWKGAVFLVFLFFGFLLIRSVMREIKLREALQQAYAKLQVLDKAKSEFISIASHQLRTPLTAIKGYISMILEGSYGEMPEKAQRPVENVYKSAERLINLVNDLLSVSRLEAGKIKVEPKKVCIEELILGIIEELKIKAEEKKIYLKFQQPLNPLPKVIIDPNKIRQVILNIIDNAIRYTIIGGITVEAEVEAGKLRVIIADTGEGMTREERSHLFESFSRGAAGGRLWTEGSGLGLYVARRFVEIHQGKVWVESEGKGKGSTFFIELPRRFGNNENFDKFMKAV